MALARRYDPSWPPGETAFVGMDFSHILPPGVTLTAAELEIVVNTNPVRAQADWTQSACETRGRTAWCFVGGGAEGTDYQLRWTVSDNLSHTWHRTGLLLCAESS